MIEISGAHFSWSTQPDRRAFEDIDLEIARGELVAVLGPSGCGKSSLLQCIAGLQHLGGGTLKIGSDSQPARALLLFQDAHLFPWSTVRGNIELGRKLGPNDDGSALARNDKTDEILQAIDMQDHADRYPGQLSGGMRQRVALGRALANEPDILLLDEPFSALDFRARARMGEFLLSIWRDYALTIVFVTHSIDEAIELADRIVIMSDAPGRIIDTLLVTSPRPRDLAVPEHLLLRADIMRHFTHSETASAAGT
jgi:ABC-type nitrate/sulfonate/bicarbonate transport system ATPase subunit